jgi:hypothetical protein
MMEWVIQWRCHLYALSQNGGKRLLVSSCPSVRPHGTAGRILMKFDNWVFFGNLSRKFVSSKSDKNNGYFIWKLNKFFLKWETFQAKAVEKIKTYILCLITFFRKSCRLWDNVEKYGRARQATDDNIIRRMRFECCITKATDTHSEYEMFIVFPRQKWLRERAAILRYTYITSLVPLRFNT